MSTMAKPTSEGDDAFFERMFSKLPEDVAESFDDAQLMVVSCCFIASNLSGFFHRNKSAKRHLHQQGIDTTTPGGKALFQMMGVFAEFERSMIRERVKAGLERARSQGKRLGRPRVSPEIEQAIRDARAEGKGMLKVAREVGVGTATVQRVLGA